MTTKLLSLLLLMSMTTCIHTIQGTVKKETRPTRHVSEEERELLLHAPVNVNNEGISDYLQNVYNQREYTEVLANNFSHVIQFLQHGKATHQSHAYAKSILKLFSNKLKATPYVNAYALNDLLSHMPTLLAHYFTVKRTHELDPYKEKINSILYATFFSKYEAFKQNPQNFFNDLSQEILESLQSGALNVSDDISKEELRQTIVRFLDLALSKLIWNPEEQEKVWDSFKAIAGHLETLVEHNIINSLDDVDDLSWTLIYRFCFFLDIVRPELPQEFYEKIKNDLATQELSLLAIEEQEPLIEPKGVYLLRAVIEGQAHKQGIASGLVIG